jgi:hypothetical protein
VDGHAAEQRAGLFCHHRGDCVGNTDATAMLAMLAILHAVSRQAAAAQDWLGAKSRAKRKVRLLVTATPDRHWVGGVGAVVV